MRQLTESDVEITLSVEQDDIAVRGNACVSGDDEADREIEDQIIARLNDGDVWAWAAVTVTARWHDFVGEAHLGACSYDSEKAFREDAYFADLKSEAIADLNARIVATRDTLRELET